MEKKTKVFRLNENVIDKIEQLVFNENQKNESVRTTQTDIVINAINYYHANILGKDVFDENMNKLEMVIGNRVKNEINEYNKVNAIALENIYNENRFLVDALLLLIRSINSLPDDPERILVHALDNKPIEEAFKQAILEKKRIENS